MQSRTFTIGSALPLLTVAGVIFGLGSIGTVMALVFIPVGEASVIWAMQPFGMIVLAWLILKERTPLATILLCVVGVAGVIVIVTSGRQGTAENRLLGPIFASGTAISAAAYTVWMRQVRESVDPFSALIVVQAATLAVAIYYELAHVLFLFGLRQMEAGKAGMFMNLVPVFTILLALIVLGERLSSVQWIGSAVVVIAVTLAGWLDTKAAR